MNEQQVSASDVERTRKIGARLFSEFLQQLASVKQEHAAACMGVDPSTISRIKGDAEKLCQLMAAMGIQFAPADAMVVSKAQLEAYEEFAYEYLRPKVEARRRA
ncbi:transcriptional regulator [Bordetella sp. J329]|nr:transcriptional regulator [Bordetella sp. J329]